MLVSFCLWDSPCSRCMRLSFDVFRCFVCALAVAFDQFFQRLPGKASCVALCAHWPLLASRSFSRGCRVTSQGPLTWASLVSCVVFLARLNCFSCLDLPPTCPELALRAGSGHTRGKRSLYLHMSGRPICPRAARARWGPLRPPAGCLGGGARF